MNTYSELRNNGQACTPHPNPLLKREGLKYRTISNVSLILSSPALQLHISPEVKFSSVRLNVYDPLLGVTIVILYSFNFNGPMM